MSCPTCLGRGTMPVLRPGEHDARWVPCPACHPESNEDIWTAVSLWLLMPAVALFCCLVAVAC